MLKEIYKKVFQFKDRIQHDNYHALKNRLIEHEGAKNSAYQDSKGFWTIGIGRLIDARLGGKISNEEMIYLLDNDIKRSASELKPFKWFTIQDKVRQEVLIELVISMGLGSLLGFKNMIAALEKKDYLQAGRELVDSKWSREDVSHNRSVNVRFRLEHGRYS